MQRLVLFIAKSYLTETIRSCVLSDYCVSVNVMIYKAGKYDVKTSLRRISKLSKLLKSLKIS